MTEYQREQEIKTLLNAHLVLPVVKLRETHPDHFFTPQGYEMLLDGAYMSLKEYLKD